MTKIFVMTATVIQELRPDFSGGVEEPISFAVLNFSIFYIFVEEFAMLLDQRSHKMVVKTLLPAELGVPVPTFSP